MVNGGAILNRPIWMQITADVLNQKLTASSEREATSRGAALMALESLKEIPSIESAGDRLVLVRSRPFRHEVYRAAMERQAKLYDLLLNTPP